MKKTVLPGKTPDNWDAEALFLKAERFAQRMVEVDSDNWEHALWSSLSLELLARAALSNVSPALLAENDKVWGSLYHSLGFAPTEERFSPKSIAITEVFRRLASIFPHFTKEHESFCIRDPCKTHGGFTGDLGWCMIFHAQNIQHPARFIRI